WGRGGAAGPGPGRGLVWSTSVAPRRKAARNQHPHPAQGGGRGACPGAQPAITGGLFMSRITRRTLIATSGTAAAAALLPGLATPASAAAPATGKQAAGLYRYRIGSYEMTALHDGTWFRPIDDKFIRNVPWADVQKALADNFLPTDKLPLPFTALLVNTGARLVLIDTGT